MPGECWDDIHTHINTLVSWKADSPYLPSLWLHWRNCISLPVITSDNTHDPQWQSLRRLSCTGQMTAYIRCDRPRDSYQWSSSGMLTMWSAVLWGLVALTCTVSGDPDLWPLNEELVYKFSADVRGGVLEPEPFASYYDLEGTLHLQGMDNSALLKLSDLQYRLYNGRLNSTERPEAVPIPVTQNIGDLTDPFAIYYKDGKVTHLNVGSSEDVWTVNIKKAIASMLQIDLNLKVEQNTPTVLFSKEKTIYGICDIMYSFTPGNEYNIITKTVNPKTCDGFPHHIWSNMRLEVCNPDAMKDEPLTVGQEWRFHIIPYNPDTKQGPKIIKIRSKSTVVAVPFQGTGEAHYVVVRQSLNLLEMDKKSADIVLPSTSQVHSLTYVPPPPDSYAKRDRSTDELIGQALDLIEKIISYLEESHVQAEAPDLARSVMISLLINDVLVHMNTNELNTCFNQLNVGTTKRDADKRELFVLLLPYIGTHSSTTIIQQLIYKKKVKPPVAEVLLQKLPMNIRNPSEKTLEELEGLLQEDYSKDVLHATILNFGILVFRSCQNDFVSTTCNETVSKYADHYFQKIIESKNDYETQLLYLQGLRNMRVGKAAFYLQTIASEKNEFSRHLRHHALWGAALYAYLDPHFAFTQYWPVLTNSKEHLQLRSAALLVLLNSGQETAHYLKLHWYMDTQRDNIHLYNLYYTAVKSMAASKNPCGTHRSTYATKLTRFMLPPKESTWVTSFNQISYLNPVNGIGNIYTSLLVGDHNTGLPSSLYLEWISSLGTHNIRKNALYINVEGFQSMIQSYFPNYKALFPNSPAYHTSTDTNKQEDDNIHIELIGFTNGFVSLALYINKSSITEREAKDYIDIATNTQSKYDIDFPVITNIHIPTGLGVPVQYHVDSPEITSFNDDDLSMEPIHIDFRSWEHLWISLSVMNPATGSSHGVMQSKMIDSQAQFSVFVHRKDDLNGIVFSQPEGLDHNSSSIGLQMYGQTVTYVHEKHQQSGEKLLQKSCSTCEHAVVVSDGKDHQKEVVFHHSHHALGFISELKTFNCEQDIDIPFAKDLLKNAFDSSHMSDHDNFFKRLLLAFDYIDDYTLMAYHPGQCGLIARWLPSPELPAGTQFQLNILRRDVRIQAPDTPDGHSPYTAVLQLALVANDTVIRKIEIDSMLMMKSNLQILWATYEGETPQQKGCVNLSKTYSDLKDIWHPEDDNKGVHVALEVVKGTVNDGDVTTCPKDDPEITVVYDKFLTEEQKKLVASKHYPFSQCELDKMKPEWQGTVIPWTPACFEANTELTKLREYNYNITFKKLSQETSARISYLETQIKSLLSDHYTVIDSPYFDNNCDQRRSVEAHVKFSVAHPTVDIRLKTPHEHYEFSDVPCSLGFANCDFWLDSMDYAPYFYVLQDNPLFKTCILTTEHIIKPDNTTVDHKYSPDFENITVEYRYDTIYTISIKHVPEDKPLVLRITSDSNSLTLDIQGDETTLNGEKTEITENLENAIMVKKYNGFTLAFITNKIIIVDKSSKYVAVKAVFDDDAFQEGLCDYP